MRKQTRKSKRGRSDSPDREEIVPTPSGDVGNLFSLSIDIDHNDVETQLRVRKWLLYLILTLLFGGGLWAGLVPRLF